MSLVVRRYRLVIVAMMVAFLSAWGSISPVDAQPPGPPERPPGAWVHLGPPGNFHVNDFAVSPRWPDDPFMIALGSGALRTADGGSTWERASAPSLQNRSWMVAPPTPGGRIIFAVGRSSSETALGLAIWRSTDGGTSWSTVLTTQSREGSSNLSARLTLSPGFDQDGHAFAIHNGLLYRSQDFGATWTIIQPAGVLRIQQVVPSPAFTTDRTVVVAAVTGTFPPPWGEQNDVKTSAHHESSLGVMISTDGGDTWQTTSNGLAVGDTPYRYVQHVALSPSFDQDGVLFAFSWGPWDGQAVPSGLFRSSDRGQTWTHVWQSTVGKDELRWSASIGLSPAFGMDGVGQMTLTGLTTWNAGPHGPVPGRTYSTTDSGQTWTEMPATNGRPAGWNSLNVAAGGPRGRTAYSINYRGEGGPRYAYRSLDDGASWELIRPPGFDLPTGYWPHVVSRDGTFLVGTRDGIWALRPPPNMPAPPADVPDEER
jgi:photosystem II stability/assembly factor-like uncharacterized protein